LLWILVALAALTVGGVLVSENLGRKIQEVTLPLRHEDVIRQQAEEKSLDASLIAAMIYTESRFRDQTSTAGAKGLMQILPGTASFIADRSGGTGFEVADLADPDINIRYGAWYLRYLLDRYGGSELAAVAAYNAGHSRVDEWGGSQMSIGDIRFPETRHYAQEVLRRRGEYRRRYSAQLGI